MYLFMYAFIYSSIHLFILEVERQIDRAPMNLFTLQMLAMLEAKHLDQPQAKP